MDTKPQSHPWIYTALLCFGFFYSVGGMAQSHSNEAVLAPDASLLIPALKVGEQFYEVRLTHQAPTWTLASALNISPVDSEYLTGNYANDILDLPCVHYDGGYYSAQLASTAPGSHSFTLAFATKLGYCSISARIGPVRGQWIRTAEPPLSARNYSTIAWTGAEIIVTGGIQFYCPPFASCAGPTVPPFVDGAAYNPLTDSWRKIADAPASILAGRNTATINGDIFALAETDTSRWSVRLLRYRSGQDRWDEFDLPVNSGQLAIAAYGPDIVLYSQTDESGSMADWQLNPATGQWTQIPDDPLGPAFNRQFVPFGEDIYLFDHALVPSPGGADGPSYLRAARLRGQVWELLPVADSIGPAPTLIAGQRLIAPVLGCADGGQTNGYGRCIPYGAVFETDTDTWHELPNAPGLGVKYIQSSGGLSTNDLVLYKAGRPALDATTNQWFTVPFLDTDPNTVRSMQAAGPYGFAFGGASSTGELLKDAWIWQP